MVAVRRWARVAWTLLSVFVVESIVFGLAVLPAALFWQWHLTWHFPGEWARIVTLAMAFVPAYLLFAVALMLFSASAARLFGWRTPTEAEMRIRDLAVRAAAKATPLPPEYHRLFHWWFAFGFPAFAAVLGIFWLMVARPAIPRWD